MRAGVIEGSFVPLIIHLGSGVVCVSPEAMETLFELSECLPIGVFPGLALKAEKLRDRCPSQADLVSRRKSVRMFLLHLVLVSRVPRRVEERICRKRQTVTT